MSDDHLLEAVFGAAVQGAISQPAAVNVRSWLTRPEYAEYVPIIAAHIREGNWKGLDEAFWTVVPFGTAGRRGRMYPIGTATINDRTIGESAQGLADYVLDLRSAGRGLPDGPRVAIAYDTRHRSRHFAELCAEIMTAADFEVFLFNDFRPTPELAITVCAKSCDCGIMISASHNPPSDNAIKVFWSTGGQLNVPHDAEVIRRVAEVRSISRRPFAEGLASGQIQYCQNEMDRRYHEAVLAQGFDGPRDLKILYSPLHGVGTTSIEPILNAAGFDDLEVFGPHATPDGDFPNVPQHVANPENPAVFDAPIARAESIDADVVLASDPDADRIGVAARVSPGGPFRTLGGNQIGVLLADYVLQRRRAAGRLSAEHFVVTTLVSTDMLRRVADHHGIRCFDDCYTGFKWIGATIDREGPARFVFGFEEAHGYLAGDYIRDKDGAVAALLLSQLAAECKAAGLTLHQRLKDLYRRVGYHLEKTTALTMPGANGMARMQEIMTRLRSAPPATIGGLAVRNVRDYLTCTDRPKADLLVFDLDGGNRAAVRPSGTEPKIKFYLFASEPPERSQDSAAAAKVLSERIGCMDADFLRFGSL